MEVSSARGLSPSILHGFGLDATDIRREKAGYVCKINSITVFVQKARANRETLIFAHYVKEKLLESGFTETDRYMTTQEGLPYYEFGGDIYTAILHSPGLDTRFDVHAAVCDIAQFVGKMHMLTKASGFFDSYSGPVVLHRDHGAFVTENGFNKQLKIMRGYKKTLQKQGRLSDFDVLFLKHFDNYEGRMSRCMELAASNEVIQTLGSGVFSHNLLKEETLLIKNGTMYITCFDECSGGHFLFDLASIIKRHIKTADNSGVYALDEILNAYSEINSLSAGGIKTLYAILLYPDKFYKTCVNYYSKKRTWTPASFNTVLEDLTARADDGFRFLSGYFEGLIGSGSQLKSETSSINALEGI